MVVDLLGLEALRRDGVALFEMGTVSDDAMIWGGVDGWKWRECLAYVRRNWWDGLARSDEAVDS